MPLDYSQVDFYYDEAWASLKARRVFFAISNLVLALAPGWTMKLSKKSSGQLNRHRHPLRQRAELSLFRRFTDHQQATLGG